MIRRLPLIVLLALLVLPVWGQTTHSITIAWTYAQGQDPATGFFVYRATTSGGPYTKITNPTPLPITQLTYVDTTGVGGTKYFYVVTAVDASAFESAMSPEASATFLANPAVPAGVTATPK
jgi:fibronectin type 3 domain-containing protein